VHKKLMKRGMVVSNGREKSGRTNAFVTFLWGGVCDLTMKTDRVKRKMLRADSRGGAGAVLSSDACTEKKRR